MDSPREQARRPAPPAPAGKPKMPPRRTWLWFAAILLVNYSSCRQLFLPDADAPLTVPYTRVQGAGRARATSGAIYSRGATHRGPLRGAGHLAAARPNEARRAADAAAGAGHAQRPAAEPRTRAPLHDDAARVRRSAGSKRFLIDHKVEISAVPIQRGRAAGPRCCFGFGPALLIIGFYVWMYRRAPAGRRHGRRADGHRQEQGAPLRPGGRRPSVTFDDVAGIDEAENELVEIVDFLKAPEQVHAPGRHRAQGRAAGRRAGHRQDAAGARRSPARRACRSSR